MTTMTVGGANPAAKAGGRRPRLTVRSPVPVTIDYEASSSEEVVWSEWEPAQYAPVPFGDEAAWRRDRARMAASDRAWYAEEVARRRSLSAARAQRARAGEGLVAVTEAEGLVRGSASGTGPGAAEQKKLQRYIVPRRTFDDMAGARGAEVQRQRERHEAWLKRKDATVEEIVLPVELLDLETLSERAEGHREAGQLQAALGLLNSGLGVRVLRRGCRHEETAQAARRLAEVLVDEGQYIACQALFKLLGDRTIAEQRRELDPGEVVASTRPRPASAIPLGAGARASLPRACGNPAGSGGAPSAGPMTRRPMSALAVNRAPGAFRPRTAKLHGRVSPYSVQGDWGRLRPQTAKVAAPRRRATPAAPMDEAHALNVVNSLLKVAELVRQRVPGSHRRVTLLVGDALRQCSELLPRDHRKAERVRLLHGLLKGMERMRRTSPTWAEDDALAATLLADHVDVWGRPGIDMPVVASDEARTTDALRLAETEISRIADEDDKAAGELEDDTGPTRETAAPEAAPAEESEDDAYARRASEVRRAEEEAGAQDAAQAGSEFQAEAEALAGDDAPEAETHADAASVAASEGKDSVDLLLESASPRG